MGILSTGHRGTTTFNSDLSRNKIMMIHRLETIIDGFPNDVKPLERISPGKIRTQFHIVVPEDSEDYWEPMSILKLKNGEYVLAQHNTGIIPGHTKLTSKDYAPLKRYGDYLFK